MRFDQLASALQAPQWLQNPLASSATSSSSTFDWDNTPATKHFTWRSCYDDKFKCARLQMPMDWTGTSAQANKTVEIAVIKVEATVPVTDRTYGGAVVLNPGGPGGSGISQVLKGGYHVRTILSAGLDTPVDEARYFDIIGFDPRNVNNTRPLISCYPDRFAAAAAALEHEAHGFTGSSDTSFDNQWAKTRAEAESCSQRAVDNGIGMHMDTAPVARDVIEIFERHGEWREAEAKRLLRTTPSLSQENKQEVEARTLYQPDSELIQYWGFSYGSILGATLAAMYPERIKRAVLDGVADSHDYMKGGWTTNLRDTDLLYTKLASYCFSGGPSNCPIYHADGPAVIAQNIQSIITYLRSNPVSVPDFDGKGPEIATYQDLMVHIRDIVYNPLAYFPATTQILYDISRSNGTSLVSSKMSHRADLSLPVPDACSKDGPYSPSCFRDGDGGFFAAQSGILCTDAEPGRFGQSKEEYWEYAQGIMKQSRLIGAPWSSIQMACTAWKAKAHWRYDGNFHNTTAHPILFAGNTIDPVTPLYNAFLMARGFSGAGVLHQNSEGHCTYGSVSMCTGKALRAYFQTGKLPGGVGELKEVDEWEGWGKLCEPDRIPLDGYEKDGQIGLPEGESDEEIWDALVGLNQNWP